MDNEQNQGSTTVDKAQQAFDSFANTADATGSFSQDDIENNKILSLFAYIGILFLVPLLAAKDSPYARFHASQGLTLFIVEIAYAIVVTILTFIIPLLGLVLNLIFLLFLVLAIVGIVNAVSGKAKELPIIGGIKLLK